MASRSRHFTYVAAQNAITWVRSSHCGARPPPGKVGGPPCGQARIAAVVGPSSYQKDRKNRVVRIVGHRKLAENNVGKIGPAWSVAFTYGLHSAPDTPKLCVEDQSRWPRVQPILL